MDEDSTKDITLTGSDADGDTLTYTIITQPTHGTLTGTVPNITYIPEADYSGTDSFSFKVNDGTVDSDPATVSITINDIAEPNHAPTPTFTTFTMDEDTSYSGTLTATDPESDALTFAKVSDPAHGSVTVDANGNFTYVPDANYNGSDSFTYSVSDGTNAPVTQAVSITINDIAEPDTTPPVIVLNGDAVITLTAGDTYTELGAVANDDRDGALSVDISGSVDTSAAGTYTLVYSCTDSSGNRAEVTRTVIVNEADDITPDNFDIYNIAGIALGSTIYSNEITISGVNTTVNISTTLGTLVIDGVDT